MKGFNVLTAGRVVFLLAVFAFSVSAEEALFHNLNGAAGGKDLAGLKVEGSGFGQNQNVSGEGSGNEHFTSFGFLFPVKDDFYYGFYYTKGTVIESGMFKGFDFIGGFANHVLLGDTVSTADISVGLGCALGYDLVLVENLHVLIGGSLGLYFEYLEKDLEGHTGGDDNEMRTYSFNFIVPTIKIQYSWIEIAYRGLIGYYKTSGNVTVGSGKYKVSQDIKDSGFDWTRHLLTIGFCFGRNK